MLKRFAVENYRLFDQRVEFDLVRTHNYGFNKNLIRNGLVNKGYLRSRVERTGIDCRRIMPYQRNC